MIVPRTVQESVNAELVRQAGCVAGAIEEIVPQFITNGTRINFSKSDFGKKSWSVSLTVEFDEVTEEVES